MRDCSETGESMSAPLMDTRATISSGSISRMILCGGDGGDGGRVWF